MRRMRVVAAIVCLWRLALGGALPRAGRGVEVVLPNFGAELRAFDAPQKRPVSWWPHVVNAAWGGGRGGPERTGGWLDQHWIRKMRSWPQEL